MRPDSLVERFRALNLELPTVVVINMFDEPRDFGARVKVFPCEVCTRLVVVEDNNMVIREWE